GALSWNLLGNQFFQMSGGSRMWQSASTISYLGMGSVSTRSDDPSKTSGRQPNAVPVGSTVDGAEHRARARDPAVAGIRESDRDHAGVLGVGDRIGNPRLPRSPTIGGHLQSAAMQRQPLPLQPADGEIPHVAAGGRVPTGIPVRAAIRRAVQDFELL